MTILRKYINQTSAYSSYAPTILATLLGFTLVIMLISCLQQWRADWTLAHQVSTPAYVSTKNETAEMIAAIPETHIFGQNISSKNTPISDLQLRVTGIVSIEEEKHHGHSKAYISISGQPAKIYQIGDTLPVGVKVYDITPDTVILDHDGKLEKLPLPREGLKFKSREKEAE